MGHAQAATDVDVPKIQANLCSHTGIWISRSFSALESNFTILQLPNQTPDLVFVEGLIGSIYLERAEDHERYREVFNRLQSIALNPKDTYDLIESLGRSYRDYSEA